MPAPLDLTGRVLGLLTVLGRGERVRYGSWQQGWICRCQCGTVLTVPQNRLPHAEWVTRFPGRVVSACLACRGNPCRVCGENIPLRGDGHGRPVTCSPECKTEYQQRRWREGYHALPEEKKQRILERRKRKRQDDPEWAREVDRRKYARQARDAAAMRANRQRAREWYAQNRERVQTERAAKKLALHGPLPEIICPGCGKSFAPPRRDSVFCSADCRHAQRPLPARGCLACGRSFVPVHSGRLTCSEDCRQTRRQGQVTESRRQQQLAELQQQTATLGERVQSAPDRRVPCKNCGKRFLPGRRKRPFCSRPCREYWREQSVRMRPCSVCGRDFAGHKRNEHLCSTDCRAEHKRRRALGRLEGEASVGSETRRCARCSTEFIGHANAEYCSADCIRDAKQERERQRVDRERYACGVCGKSLADAADLRTNRYTCSAECRAEANRRKARRAYIKRRNKNRGENNGSGSESANADQQ